MQPDGTAVTNIVGDILYMQMSWAVVSILVFIAAFLLRIAVRKDGAIVLYQYPASGLLDAKPNISETEDVSGESK